MYLQSVLWSPIGGFGTQKTPVPKDFLVLNYLENGVKTLLLRQNLHFMGIEAMSAENGRMYKITNFLVNILVLTLKMFTAF